MTIRHHVSLIGCALWVPFVVAPSAAVASVGGPELPQASAVVAVEEVLTDPVEALTDGLQSQDGFVPIHFDQETGRILLEVTRLDEDFLYAYGLASGLGYPVGVGGAPPELPQLDRGHIESGNQALVHFERHDSRLMLVEKNLAFRALTDDESQRQAVESSFPTSVLGVFPIVESTSPDRYLVDGTDFFLSDVFDVRGRLLRTGVDIRIDRSRSYVDMEYTKAFPKNSEVRAVLTFEADAPSPGLQRLVRDARTFAMEQHHSFVELPPPGFETRKLDPRVGSNPLEFWDFAQPFDGDRYLERYILRWRLEKRDPDAEISEPVEPIVYHLDPAMPEPYRTAIAESTLWWNEAFERAGFRNAVEVRDLPEGADPMDARYSVILWTHRTGQGSSTGPTLFDPRTGEILKALVRLDSHRGLHNYNLYAGLQPAMEAGGGFPVSAEEFAMSVRHWHAVHETGHSLGFAHNFLGGALGHSMMDYRPAVYGVDARGQLDMSEALRDGLGPYDHILVQYAYTPFESPEEEAAGLDAIIQEAFGEGLRFLGGPDATLQGSVPQAHRWIDGADLIESLARNMAVRRVGIEHFDETAIRPSEPMWLLANRLTHVYLLHLYHLDAATKYVGGEDYTYALRGDGQTPTRIFPAAEQREALELILEALSPESLKVPERITTLIPPLAHGYYSDDLYIRSPTGLVFDALTLPRTLSHHVVENLLHPERASRMVSFHARDAANPSLGEVVSRLVEASWGAPPGGESMDRALLRITQQAVLDGLFRLAVDERAPGDVRAVADHHLAQLADRLSPPGAVTDEDWAHRSKALRDINRYVATGSVPLLKTGVFDVITDLNMYTRWP